MNDRPWLSRYGDMDPDVDVPDATMYELFRQAADRWPATRR